FQAEDGIRDGHVTGVQTCALPIWQRAKVRDLLALLAVHPDGLTSEQVGEALWPDAAPGRDHPAGAGDEADSDHTDGDLLRNPPRSEERRVGKERRSRWAPD